jgi:uncharacterized protein YkwD
MKKHEKNTAVKWKLMAAVFAALVAAACFGERRADALDIHARNDFNTPLEIVLVYYDDETVAWTTRGWYRVEAKQSRILKSESSKRDIYIYAQLAGGKTTWGKGDITRVIVSEMFAYGDAEECPAGTNRRSVKFTKYTARNGVVNFRPVMDSQPLPNAGGAAAPAPNAGGGRPGNAGFRPQTSALQLIELINYERRAAGVAALQIDENLMKAAAQRAAELMRKYDHQRPDGREYHTAMKDFGLNPNGSAENITLRADGSALETNRQFSNSPGHKKNMLNADYIRVGVGVYKEGPKYGWVELFAGEEFSAEKEKSLSESFKELKEALKELEDIF